MAKKSKTASREEWGAHIVCVAEAFSGRTFSPCYFEFYPQEPNRIYEDWLQQSGLEIREYKTMEDLEREKELLFNQRKRWVELHKIKNRPFEFLKQVSDETDLITFPQDDHLCIMAKRLLNARSGLQDTDGFFEFLRFVDKRAKFLWAEPLYGTDTQTWIDPLIRLWHRRGQWHRLVEDWRPNSHNRERQFASLLRHLLSDYDVPVFMDTVWLRNDKGSARLRDAWVHVARGKNIRSAKGLPMSLTKKAAHILQRAPEELTFEHAMKWAQMQTFHLRPRACAAMLGSRWGSDFTEISFWESVLRFLSANPMISPDRIGPIVDYIYTQKFEGPVLLVDGDDILRDDPPHPGFTMRGRQGQALLDQVEAWHRELARTDNRRGKARKAMDVVYCKSGWKTLNSEEKLNLDEKAIWHFVEILTEGDLHAEGRAMRHCIYSYHARVVMGDCSVWSLRTIRKGGPHDGSIKRQLTIEVSANGRINEARGRANSLPEGRAAYLLREWANKNRMSIAPYVFM